MGEKRRIIPKTLGRGENRRFGLREKKSNDELRRNKHRTMVTSKENERSD